MAERISMTFDGYTREVDVPDGVVATIHDAFADAYGRPETVVDPSDAEATIPNPQSKESYTTERVRLYIEQIVAGYAKKMAVAAAAAAADSDTQNLLGSIVIDPS